MELPFYVQKAVDLGLLKIEDGKIIEVNKEAIETTVGTARLVEKLQPTTIADREDTTDQEAIILCRILISPSGISRDLWSKFRIAFGVGHGQELPAHLWSNPCFRAIGKEIDMTFIGERTGSTISKNSLITGYEQMNPTNRDVLFSDFCTTISELTSEETMNAYGDQSTEWSTALDILKQKRALSLYKETIYLAGQSLKTDPKLEKALEFIHQRTMDGISMLSGSIGNQGQVTDLTQSIIGDPGSGRLNWTDYIIKAESQDRPVSTGVNAFDIDIDGGVSPPRPNMPRAGRLLVIGARTGVGKTALGVQVAASLAKGGLTVGFVSAELDSRSIEARIIANLSRQFFGNRWWRNAGDDYGYVTVGELELPGATQNQQRIAEIVAQTSMILEEKQGKILVESPWGADVETCINTMRSMKAKHPELRAVVIDHFHALARHKGASTNNPAAMLEDRAYRLMTAAKELDIDLFTLAQLNRIGMDTNSNPEPQLNEIRGTDALAHVSHATWLVRKVKLDGDKLNKDLEVWHSKVRGRQAVWKEGKEVLDSIKGFIEKSIVRMQYETSFVEGDTTKDLIKERQGLG
jgi:KaiC/GvpD/RAD55 family RecA-like ATPase